MLPPSLRLLVVGLNHKTAPLAVRERVAFSPAQVGEALAAFKAAFPESEAVLLSTCNRVELYVARPVSTEPLLEKIVGFLAEVRGLTTAGLMEHLYHHQDRAAVEHLFSVAASLDSMVVGETQILAQVKHAYQAARDAGTAGKVFHAMFQRALAAAKQVHEETELSAGRLSVASVAVELAQSVFDRFDDKVVLCIGAGEMTSLMLRHIQELKPKRIRITNRTPERALKLAEETGGHGAPFECLEQLLTDADIVLTCTGATDPIVTSLQFKGLLKRRKYRPVVIVDIALPRDVEAAVGELPNVYLYNLDDLQQVVATNRDKRDVQVLASRELLAAQVEEFLHWFAARDVGPMVKALYEQANATAKAELDALLAKHPELTAEQRADLEKLTHRLIGKLLHGPVSELTQRKEHDARPMLTEAFRKLFRL